MTYRCSSCKRTEAEGATFAPSVLKRSGGWCKGCSNAYNRIRNKKPAAKARRRLTRHVNGINDPVKKTIDHRKYNVRRYGITIEDYDQMRDRQNGLCLICGEPPKMKVNLVIDHCHKTDKIRGLLCGACNVGLGSFRDKVQSLENAIRYLKHHNPEQSE